MVLYVYFFQNSVPFLKSRDQTQYVADEAS